MKWRWMIIRLWDDDGGGRAETPRVARVVMENNQKALRIICTTDDTDLSSTSERDRSISATQWSEWTNGEVAHEIRQFASSSIEHDLHTKHPGRCVSLRTVFVPSNTPPHTHKGWVVANTGTARECECNTQRVTRQ